MVGYGQRIKQIHAGLQEIRRLSDKDGFPRPLRG